MPRLLALLVIAMLGCGDGAPPRASAVAPYRLAEPDTVFALPPRLEEISGLTWLGDGLLGAVEDERGDLYVIDAATGEVVRTHAFGGRGDYEGVERAGDRAFVLRSDGRLFVLADWEAEEAPAAEVRLPLHGSCDAEGLAFEPARDRLLIACKEGPGRGWQGHKTIFSYDLAGETFDLRPAFAIQLDSLAVAAGGSGLDDRVRALVRPVADISGFKPSALAVHPVTGEIYVLSSVRKLLVVLAPGGSISAVWGLPERLLPQPEGLTFSPDGTLFVASEGRGRRATLLRYSYHSAE